MSNFEKVINFNKTFGQVVNTKPMNNILIDNPKLVENRLKLITEEVDELKKGIEDKNFAEVVDALIDILYVTYGMGSALGINMDKAFDIVHENNMSKLCKTEEEANKTVQYYKDHPELGFTTPRYRQSIDGLYWVVYNEASGKVLKSVNYKVVDLAPIL